MTADPKHRLTIECSRKMFPSLNYNGNWGLLGLGHPSLPPTLFFAQSEPLFGSSRVKFPGLCSVGVCFFFFFFKLDDEFSFGRIHSGGPPCSAEQKRQIFLGAANDAPQEAAQWEQPPSLCALAAILLLWEGGWEVLCRGSGQIGSCLSSPAVPPGEDCLSSCRKPALTVSTAGPMNQTTVRCS